MIRYHAAWVVPVGARPIRDGWVAIDRQRIVALGKGAVADHAVERDLGQAAILPGLVNAHTHLELSYLRDRIPPAREFTTWIRSILAARRERGDPEGPEIVSGVERGIEEATAAGTAVVGDISNTLVTFGPLAESALAAVVFYELIRFNAPDPAAFVEEARRRLGTLPATERVRPRLAAHAPYSVAPLVFRAICEVGKRDDLVPWSVHVSESAQEVEFIMTGEGPWRDLLEELGAWNAAWVAPRVSPVEYLDSTGFLDSRALAVHGVQMTSRDLERIAARGTTLVTCPRSNRYTGAGDPPVTDFYRAGIRVAVGTDSLASVPDLNVFAELAAMRALAPAVPASWLLDSATSQGARALGLGDDYGALEPGKLARMIAVAVPPGTNDVEEYLVSGIEPAQVRWVPDHE